VLILLGLVVPGPAWAEKHTAETIERSFDVAGTPELHVRNVDGPTFITGHQAADVHVRAIKEVHKAKSEDEAKRAAGKVKVEIQQVGNRIEVGVKYPKNLFSFGTGPHTVVRLEISGPHKSNVDAQGVDGSLEATGFEGVIRLKTVDGDLLVKACQGEISAQSVDGDLRLEGVGGAVEARTIDGDLKLGGKLQSLRAKSTDGDVTIRVAPGSAMAEDWSLRTSDGSVDVSLPEAFAADLDIRTSDGHISSDFPLTVQKHSEGTLAGKLNGGGRRLTIRTSDGSVRITK
jgi:hypothetical protein